MLSLEPPFFEIDGVSIFRDHALATQFYYLAPHPSIARDGARPMFDLFAYTVALEHSALAGTSIPNELGAGFLTLGVSCELSEARKQRLSDTLATRLELDAARVSVLPVPYHAGSVRVIALDRFSAPGEPSASAASDEPLRGRPTFVESIIGSSTPNLMGDLRSIFSLGLSQDGVAFLEGLYRDGAAPVGIVYELRYHGLRPSVQAVVHADLSTIYTHFGGGLSGQYQWLKAEVGAAIEHLEQKNAIRVELISQATGEEALKSKELALSLFKDQVLQQLFQPSTPQVPQNLGALAAAGTSAVPQGAGAATSGAAQGSLGFTLKFLRREELKTASYDYSERAPAERVHAPQAFLSLLLDEDELGRQVHHVDLDHRFFETLDVLVTGPSKSELDALRIRQVEAILTYGEPGDAVPPESRSLLFRPDSTGDKTFAVKRRGRGSLAYRYSLAYEFVSDPDIDAEAQRIELAERPSSGRTLLINPTRDFGVLRVDVQAGTLDPSITRSDVQLEYRSGDGRFTARQSFRLDTTDTPPPVERWHVRTRELALAAYRATCSFVFADGALYTAPPFESREPLLRVDSPFRFMRRLLVKPSVVAPSITQLTVEVVYEDRAGNYERRFTETFTPPFQSRELTWPILSAERQTLRYRVTSHEPGFASESAWQETEDPSIIAGAVGSRIATLGVKLIGGSLAAAGLDGLLVKLQLVPSSELEDETISLLFEPDSAITLLEARLMVPPGATFAYRYQTTAFKTRGEVTVSDWKQSTDKPLVLSIRNL